MSAAWSALAGQPPRELGRRAYRSAARRLVVLRWRAYVLARRPRPSQLVAFGGGLGDHLLCSAVFHELRARGRSGLWMLSSHRDLFRLSSDVDLVVPPDRFFVEWARSSGARVTPVSYTTHIAAEDRDIPPERHLIACLCAAAGISGPVALRPYLALSDDERASGRLAPRQIAIQSSGMAAQYPMRNKEWFPERFQAVADALAPHFQLIQIGAAADPPLAGTIDLRGRTTLRQSAAILSQSLAFVGQVGFLMHLARAVDCRSAIVYGGRELPEQSGYRCNANLASAPACAPCWQWNTCAFDRQCMRAIEPAAVVAAVERLVERHGQPLEVDTDTLP